jgi:hypothetical protein
VEQLERQLGDSGRAAAQAVSRAAAAEAAGTRSRREAEAQHAAEVAARCKSRES